MIIHWKNNAPYAMCLTHDVDRTTKQWYHYGYYALHQPGVQVKSLREKITSSDPYWNFYRLMELEIEAGVRSTFLFLNEPVRKLSANFMGRYKIQAPAIRQIILELDANGFDIGLHGSFYSYCNKEQMQIEKNILEDILGHEVVSTRQHHLNFDSCCTWNIQKQIGLRYDSTLGSSVRVETQEPFLTTEGIWELPITLMDTVPMNTPERQSNVLQACTAARDVGLIMLNFHQCHYNLIEYPQNVNVYSTLLKSAQQDGAWISNMREIGQWLEKENNTVT